MGVGSSLDLTLCYWRPFNIIVSNFHLYHSFRLESFLIIRVGDSFDGFVCYMPLHSSTFLLGISVSLKIIKMVYYLRRR